MTETVETPAAEPATAPAAPAVFTDADFNKYLSEKGLVAKPAADIQTEINQAVRKTHETWENKVGEVIGAAKPNGVAGLDWIKEAIAPKTAAEPVAAPTTETPAPKVADDIAAAEVKALRKQLAEIEVREKQTAERTVTKVINLDQENALSTVLDSKDADYEGKAAALRAAIGATYTRKVDEMDNVIYYTKDDEVATNPQTQKPLTTAEIIRKDFAFFLPKEKPQVQGTVHATPAGPTPTKDSDGHPYVVAKTYEEISAKASELGLGHGTKERTGFIQRSQKASGIQ